MVEEGREVSEIARGCGKEEGGEGGTAREDFPIKRAPIPRAGLEIERMRLCEEAPAEGLGPLTLP